MKKRNIVVANWKMNPEMLDIAKEIFNNTRLTAKSLKNTDVCLCPPFPFLHPLLKLNYPKNMFLGVQNISSEIKGAFTGEVSAYMVKSLGASFSIIGHSERRAMGESNEMIRKKMQTAFDADLTPILCVGEKERDKDGNHLEFIKNQIKESLFGLQKKYLVGITIAYEPIWAIGKSYLDAMSPTDIHETVLFIKKIIGELFGRDIALGSKILYGASVEAENVSEIVRIGNVDGFLVGHASLVPKQFSAILKATDMKR
ncbi:MAG: triose-phosphate isomerase [Candidatus Zambryskibacteria bacterium RIFCSPLOWO2_01_FULL_39_39]|uniref:Triosephosphate isomerase n=1 Tax=Candidatus Zambryskibacteria bacterium RIFCSPLOWO2_01_FULL_39_39 TaxID=1802758 RepID=A0A1G2TZJ3_9BACT|nr:MAG: triose-phosphate isomerase [Candidatus Zambryskibacteria bacterium RIFCSPHIGHO2_01_FULL_39_63]OHA95123.1 MAG: triose-phosphate isomerase [Candidatus Zambryskibacteria bacterium RIFCSPHIGHO2_02_FULL_39_19]OHA98665.1 MAG: triose-phosphate isomerase [Candidatus Zambryskibacteria bacterium RIFCSPHIGHO2_12_FULL_39_21]OHB02030.1 MAG: triose-phosphate isomerase [Candidatus Zambryskibacteria bacterium RIFCSPLOWO2_01_FULL_39_39]